jgi:hypothetical protein
MIGLFEAAKIAKNYGIALRYFIQMRQNDVPGWVLF